MKEKSKYSAQIKYAKVNLVKLGIDVKPELRDKFHLACKKNNTNASKVLKTFVNNYIEKNEKK